MNRDLLKKQQAYQRGMDAEMIAAEFLEQQGFQIIAIRHRNAGGEIDIIAREDEYLAIVEVKARQTEEDGLYSITPSKQKRLLRAAESLLQEAEKIAGLENAHTLNIRFDAVIITPAAPPLHLPNAWQAAGY